MGPFLPPTSRNRMQAGKQAGCGRTDDLLCSESGHSSDQYGRKTRIPFQRATACLLRKLTEKEREAETPPEKGVRRHRPRVAGGLARTLLREGSQPPRGRARSSCQLAARPSTRRPPLARPVIPLTPVRFRSPGGVKETPPATHRHCQGSRREGQSRPT